MKTAILLVNLGSPDSPQPKDVKRYLKEFLLDPKVVDSPWLLRQMLVRGVIVPNRYLDSAASYSQVWTDEGSPLLSYTKDVVQELQNRFGPSVKIDFAMRYRNPSLSSILKQYEKEGIENLLVLPMFPQFAEATTGSIRDMIAKLLSRWKNPPWLRVIPHFANLAGMLDAFAEHGKNAKEYDHVLLSFHGLPQKQLIKSDKKTAQCLSSPNCCEQRDLKDNCYRSHCLATAKGIVERLDLSSDQYSISFQSRLGKQEWLKPYTSDVIHSLLEKGVKKLLVFSPSFVCDCLETLYEIDIEYRHLFMEAGGEKFDLVPGLNHDPKWIDALEVLLKQEIEDLLAVSAR